MSKEPQLPNPAKIMPYVYMAGAAIVLIIIYKIFRGVGMIGRKRKIKKEEQEEAVHDLRTMPYFNPSYQDKKVFKRIGTNAANLYAENLRKAYKGIGTDEELTYSTFSKLQNRANISEVAAQYFLKFKRDLRTDTLNELKTKKERLRLYNIIKSLPNI